MFGNSNIIAMEQYISKSALVAETNKLTRENELYLDENTSDAVRFQKTGAYSVLCDLRHFIDTLEVKEVDLDFEQELYKAFGQVKDFTLGMRIAKHFFELGLKAQKGE